MKLKWFYFMKFLLVKLFRNAGCCFQGRAQHTWDSVVLIAPAEPGGEEEMGISKSCDYTS